MQELILCGDIGGTNASFSVVSLENNEAEIILLEKYSTCSISDITNVISLFLEKAKENGYCTMKGCFCVAGPVENNKFAKLTNRSLVVNADDITAKTKLDYVRIINDFEAIAYSINVIGEKDLLVLRKGEPWQSTKAVIGAGTGLGTGILNYNGYNYQPIPSEGGHCSLPVENIDEIYLAEFIQKSLGRNNFPEAEDVVSGYGLELVYKYLQNSYECPKNIPSKEISRTKETNECAKATYKIFKRFYARVCRNIVLMSLSRGGLYIGGGIAAKNTDMFDDDFLVEFLAHDRFAALLNKIPVSVITNYYISHLGAAYALCNTG
ncbi:MAG: glucokinase [Candidatus Nanoarchaeia archaeon]